MKTAIQVVRRLVSHEWGGIEATVINTARLFPRFGYAAEVFCTHALASARHETIEGVPIRRFHYFYPYLGLGSEGRSQLDKKGGNAVSFSMLWAMVCKEKVDLVHVYTGGRLAALARTACRIRGIPYVVSIQGGWFTTPAQEIAGLLRPVRGKLDYGKPFGLLLGTRRVLADAAAIICVSREECEAVKQRFPSKAVHYIPNGVDQGALACGNGDRFRAHYELKGKRIVLCVARIDPQKNQVRLVRALRKVHESIPDAVLVLIGPVTVRCYLEEIQRQAWETGVADAVRIIPGLPPYSPALADAYAAADVFVLPSIHEPFGGVVLDAWSAGKPVVASRVGGLIDLIQDGTTGLLFDPGNPEGLTEQILRLLYDPKLGDRIGTAGKHAVSLYTWAHTTEGIARVYDEVLQGTPRGGHAHPPCE